MINWIDVNDRLPVAGDGKEYLVAYTSYYSYDSWCWIDCKEPKIKSAEFKGIKYGWDLCGGKYKITHWAEINSPEIQMLTTPSVDIPEDPVDKELTKEIDEAINKAADTISKSVKKAWKKVFG